MKSIVKAALATVVVLAGVVASMSFAGAAPIGGLLAGWFAERIGLTATLAINGALIAAAGLLGRWRLHNHPEALRGIMKGLSR